MPPTERTDTDLLRFVSVALQQKELSGICQMLEAAVGAMNSWGAFLWQLHEDSKVEDNPPAGSLFVLAEWFPTSETWALENLELDSISGRVVVQGRSENVENAMADERVGKRHKWWVERNDVHCFCSVPVDFPDARATLNFYRREARPFTAEEVRRAEDLGKLFPSLYQSVRNQVSFDLLREIERKTLENQSSEKAVIDTTLREVCGLIGRTFKAFECSLFLEDRLNSPGLFSRVASTWPGAHARQTPTYRPEDPGITPWVLKHSQSVRFSNLARYTPGEEIDPVKYKGLIWNDPLDLANSIAEIRGIAKDDLPPLSYMAAPVIANGTAVGVIRCCVATEPPYYYAEREMKLLQVTAADIGHYWDNWMRHLALEAESRAWRLFIDRVRTLNDQVNEIMAKPLPDEAAIDAQCRLVSEKAGAAAMVDLLTQQQKLYKLLFQMIRSRKETEDQLQRASEAERRFYEDLFHQLKSPIFTAAATSQSALGRDATMEAYRSSLLILRAQLLKAERVTRAVQIFAELAKDREPKPELMPLELSYLLRLLAWAAEDHERLFDEKKLKFSLDRHSFSGIRNQGVLVDLNLLAHAVNNLLDNAGKYSFAGGTVRVFGGLTGTGRFHISVANKGLRLRPGEASECLKRGWRGKDAQMVTGEGSGLGLWIVYRIMRAHGGQVLVISPNSDDEFEVKLLFHYAK